MTSEKLIENRLKYKKELKELEETLSVKFTDDFQDWCNDNIPYKCGEVVEHTDDKRRKYQRFVIYDFKPRFVNEYFLVSAWGWYLNKDSVPAKWSSLNIYGMSNTDKIALSSNQKNKRVPKELAS